MTPLTFTLFTFATSVGAGVIGSLLGLGGATVVVPFLTLIVGLDFHYAAGAAIVSTIATSSGAAAAYVREHMTNLRVAMFLELGTTSGAITGAYLLSVIPKHYLYFIFAILMGYSAIMMFRKRHHALTAPPPDKWADKLQLHDQYFDQATGETVHYKVGHSLLGLIWMYVAGLVSALLGIGSGGLKVPAMDLAMHLPIKVSTATSNFMIGVTAAASAGVYFSHGYINPFIVAPVATGVLIGATIGSKILGHIPQKTLRLVFVAFLLWISIAMFRQGLHGGH